MEEDNYKYDLRSAAVGAGLGGFFSGVSVGSVVGAVSVVAVIGAAAGGAVGGKPKHSVIGGLTSLLVYSAMTFASAFGYNQGAEERLVPFSVGDDTGVVVQRGDGSQAPYVRTEGDYVLFDKVLERDLSSKVEESERTVDSLRGDYNARKEAILNSIADDKQR